MTLAIKAYIGKSKINLAIKCFFYAGLNLGPLVFQSDVFLTDLTWQELIEGY